MRNRCLPLPLRLPLVLMLLLSSLLAACASTNGISGSRSDRVADDNRIAVAHGVQFTLLPAADVLRDVVITQRIDASYRPSAQTADARGQHSFVVQIEAGADAMQMVGLTPLGVQIFALSQHGRQLDADVPAYVSLPFDPRFMLADMQLSLAPMQRLNMQLAGAQLQVAADGSWRELVAADGRQLLRIDYRGAYCTAGSEIHIAHAERNYEIRITTLSCER